MKLSNKPYNPNEPLRAPPSANLAKRGEALWQVLSNWRANKYPRTAWAWAANGEKRDTLKIRLYTSLAYLKEHGTPEQKELAVRVGFTAIANEYVLTFKRQSLTTISNPTTSAQRSPAELTVSNKNGEIFSVILSDIVNFITTTNYDGTGQRPMLEIAGVYLTADNEEEIHALLIDLPNFKAWVNTGLKGNIKVVAFSDDELEGLKKL